MPLDKNVDISGGSSKKFEPLPPDVYPVEILDVEQREGTKFNSSEKEMQLTFKLGVIEEGPHYGRFLFNTCSPKFVGGSKPSKLFSLITNATGKTFSQDEIKRAGEIITADFLNTLIGMQLRVAVSVKDRQDGQGKNNKVDMYMPKKTDLPAFDEAKAKAAYEAGTTAKSDEPFVG